MPIAARTLRAALLPLALGAVLLAGAPTASAADCGKQVINAYFNTGRIGYHPQQCYASALKQVDPDARMYSGIMGAIRAARARDRAADEQAAAPPETDAAPVETTAPPPAPVDTTPVAIESAPLPTDTVLPTLPAEPRAGAIRPQAAQAIADAEPRVPLAVIVLAGLATLLTLIGLGGLVVRYLDRGY